MKRLLVIVILALVALGAMPSLGLAEGITVSVPVTVAGGGVAVMTSEEGAPAPEATELHLADGEKGAFVIPIAEPGNYDYTAQVKDEGKPNVTYDKTVYTIAVAAFVKDDGTLGATVVLYDRETGKKPEAVSFVNKTTSSPSGGDSGSKTQGGAKHQPKTGDNAELEKNLLISMFASAGLFGLSLVYAAFTKKMTRR